MKYESNINVDGAKIGVIKHDTFGEYISLTDMAKFKETTINTFLIITNWLRNRSTIEFIGLWEQLHNPNFNYIEFDIIKINSGKNSFVLTPQRWIEATNAVGIISKPGRYGGTYAHSDIAFEFASWISPEFRLYVTADYQRLKKDEAERKAIGWDEKRFLSKINNTIHTDAIKKYLIDDDLTKQEQAMIYASEADIINMALFGQKAYEWRMTHPKEAKHRENMRDYATADELVILINLENLNADMIKRGIDKIARYHELRKVAKEQLQILLESKLKVEEQLVKINGPVY